MKSCKFIIQNLQAEIKAHRTLVGKWALHQVMICKAEDDPAWGAVRQLLSPWFISTGTLSNFLFYNGTQSTTDIPQETLDHLMYCKCFQLPTISDGGFVERQNKKHYSFCNYPTAIDTWLNESFTLKEGLKPELQQHF